MVTSIPPKATETNSPPACSPVDAHVGRQIRVWRILAGKSRTELAAAVGISRQQIQKYETGRNRVSASTLYVIAGALNVTVGQLFDGLPPTKDLGSLFASEEVSDPPSEMRFLLGHLMRLSPRLRGRVAALIHALARDEERSDGAGSGFFTLRNRACR
ncbi:helix-turn-helix domain-containing protein [Agrobacterium tumefaciens]|jgi:transcriptional regulator with XRE-family HTH domain|uniref:Helix-turn-helix transcriptional regulator n=1 Tax=Agrobacterium tumefaciens TaxID=358 RepID=A0A4D7Z731_AGRTU|nr:helix-turn-helix transcriptional regulator [Agrobacterium tumefaciens]QCL98243.1 helix-turn-helix transcriptional regulator [Agrobacterium tumefaciens]